MAKTIKSIAKYDNNSIIISTGDKPEDKFIGFLSEDMFTNYNKGEALKLYDEERNLYLSPIILSTGSPRRFSSNGGSYYDYVIIIRCPHCGQVAKLVSMQQQQKYILREVQLISSFTNEVPTYHCPDCDKDFAPEFNNLDKTKPLDFYATPKLLLRNFSNLKRTTVSFLLGELTVVNLKSNQIGLKVEEVSISKKSTKLPFALQRKSVYKDSDLESDIFTQMIITDMIKLFPTLTDYVASDEFKSEFKYWAMRAVRYNLFLSMIKNKFLLMSEFPKKEDQEFLLSEGIKERFFYDTNAKRFLQNVTLLLSKPRESVKAYVRLYNFFSAVDYKNMFSFIDIITASKKFDKNDAEFLRKKLSHLLPVYEKEVLFVLDNFENDFEVMRGALGGSYISINKFKSLYVFLKTYRKRYDKKCSKEDFIYMFRKNQMKEALGVIKVEYDEFLKDAPVLEQKLKDGRVLRAKTSIVDERYFTNLMITTVKKIVENCSTFESPIPYLFAIYDTDGLINDRMRVLKYNFASIGIEEKKFAGKNGIPELYLNMFNEKIQKFRNDKDFALICF